MADTFFKAENICKKYGKRDIIVSGNFELKGGEVVAIVGPNAGGKSTLLKILSGTIKPDSGDITFNGKKITTPSDFSSIIGYIPQANPLFEDMTVEDNLKFWWAGKEGGYKKGLESGVIEQMALEKYLKYKVRKLSGGLKKRVSIACVIADSPAILILDEPGASLDVIFKEELKTFIKSYVDENHSAIIVSHEEGELSLADRMYLMSATKLKQLDEPVYSEKLKDIISG